VFEIALAFDFFCTEIDVIFMSPLYGIWIHGQ